MADTTHKMTPAPDPLISCLMVTRPSAARLPRLRRTLEDFAGQTYARREMVVVIDATCEADAEPTLRAIDESGVGEIRAIVSGAPRTLGSLRNLSWDHARGEVVCTWDDDDRHHPTRLARQQAALAASGKEACYLQEFMHLFAEDRRIYRVNFRPAPDPVAVNTLMCRVALRERYPETGPKAQTGEDEALFWSIRDRASFHPLAGAPHLFIYVNHGANTCNEAHHRLLVDQMGSSRGLLLRYESALRRDLSAFGMAGVAVAGPNGDAFVL